MLCCEAGKDLPKICIEDPSVKTKNNKKAKSVVGRCSFTLV